VNPIQVGNQLLRIGYANTVEEPRQWVSRVKGVQRRAGRTSLGGAKVLTGAGSPADYAVKNVWRQVLEPVRGHDRDYQLAARQLAIRTGQLTEQMVVTSQLARRDPSFRQVLAQSQGRARELSGWIPRIPGPREWIEPAADNLVVHLVKESRPYFSNGFTSRSHENFKAEKAAGLDPVVITEPGFPRSVAGGGFPHVEEFEGIVHHRLDAGIDYANVPSDRWLEDFAWMAYRKVREIRPAVIHVSSGRRGYETALVALALKEKTGIPVVYEVRSFFEGNWTSETAIEDASEVYRRRVAVENMCMQEADAVLTLGEAMKGELVSRGIPEAKIGIVPNGVNLENFIPAPQDPELLERYRITMPTFGYVSNMDHKREGQEYLIRAAHVLKQRGVEAQCIIVGGGQRIEHMKALVRELGLQDRVRFTGHIDHAEVSSHYNLIDVFVVPRIRERAASYVTPLKPFEAMALGRPVVASNLPALAEIVDPPHRGRLFEPEDAAGLADAVAELLADPGLRDELGAAGRSWIENERQWKHNGPRYRRVFEDVIARAVRPAPDHTEGA
jgi:phosphatidyl-myo-inositol dimannoside synthase